MGNLLVGLQNLLMFINNNWAIIVTCLGLSLAIYKKLKTWLAKSNDEKIAIAKKNVEEIILKLCSDAESEFSSMIKAGEIKRSQVIQEIYKQYPALSTVADQEELIAWIDEIIDESLVTLRDILATNNMVVVVAEV